MKIENQLDENRFILKLDEKDGERNNPRPIIICHDYVSFSGRYIINSETHDIKGLHSVGCNNIGINCNVQIPIKAMQEVVLPILNKNKYLQPEHLAPRMHTEDDKYWESKGLDKPRYIKGDKYPAYSYYNQIYKYWEDGIEMVAFLKSGDWKFNHMTLEFFNQYVKPNL